MKLKNVGYQQHGHASDYRSGNVVVLVGEVVEVPDEYAAHLLKTFPSQFVTVEVPSPVEPDVAVVAPEFIELEKPRKGKGR
jgi:hypothetical protein